MSNIYSKLQRVRVEVNKICTKKSGRNEYGNFDYFQLEDFLPVANEEFAKEGLCPVFSIIPGKIVHEANGNWTEVQETAELIILDEAGDTIIFTSPTAEAVVGKNPNPIQNLGAKHTYLKRYLYMNALELSEKDIVDATSGKESTPVVHAIVKQVDAILSMYDDANLEKIKAYYGVDNIDKLTVQQASQVIAQKGKQS